MDKPEETLEDEIQGLVENANQETNEHLAGVLVELNNIKEKISQIEGTDISNIEVLLKGILDKKEKDIPQIDLSDLKEISSILEEILYASRATVEEVVNVKNKEVKEPKQIDYTPLLKKINDTIPNNFDEDNFLGKLKTILRDSLKIKVTGGGGGGITKQLLNSSGTLISPATEDTLQKVQGFQIPVHDYISYGYTGSDITTITYKTGGAGGATVATVTLTYDGSGNPLTKTLTL